MPKGVYQRKPKIQSTEIAGPDSGDSQDSNKPVERTHTPGMAYTDRSSILETIAARSEADQQKSSERLLEAVDTTDHDNYVNQNSESTEETSEAVQETAPETKAEVKPEIEVKKFKGIVDGAEKEYTEEEVIKAGLATLQKQTAADERLTEAKRLLEEARSMRPKESQPSGESSPDAASASKPLDAAAIAKSIMYGNDEEATKAVENLLKVVNPQQANQLRGMSQEEIARFVDEAYEFKDAKRKFQLSPEQGGFNDLWEDPQLRNLVLNMENEQIKNGDNRPYWERFQDIGTKVRTWRDSLVQKHAPKTLENREEKKREATVIKGASMKAQAPATTPESREDILNNMRKQRGQLSIN